MAGEPKKWGHDELASDLAAHLAGNTAERAIWEDMQLGPAGTIRPDVYAITKTYTRLVAMTFEVKVSRSDFLSDITSGKWQGYLKFSNCVVFAVPAGLVKADEIPKGAGLIERLENGWRFKRKPTFGHLEGLPLTVWQKLLFDGIGRERSVARRATIRNEYIAQRRRTEVALAKGGAELAALLTRRDRAEQDFAHATAQLEARTKDLHERRVKAEDEARAAAARERSDVDTELAKIARELGLPATDTSSWQIIRELRARLPKAMVADLQNAADQLRRSGEHQLREATEIERRLAGPPAEG